MRILCAAAALLFVGCRGSGSLETSAAPAAPPSIALDRTVWSARSADGRIEVRQATLDSGACGVAARDSGGQLWALNSCIASSGQLGFVSADGAWLLVIDPLPEHRGPDWSDLPVLRLYDHGNLVAVRKAGALVGPARIRDMSLDYSWLRGVGGRPGSPPRYSSPDAVVLETIEGRSVELPFGAGALPPEPRMEAAQAPAAAPSVARVEDPGGLDLGDERTLYRWEDEQGDTHFGHAIEIPPRLRRRAAPVSASIGVVTGGGGASGWRPRASTSPVAATVTPAPPPRDERVWTRVQPRQETFIERNNRLAEESLRAWGPGGIPHMSGPVYHGKR